MIIAACEEGPGVVAHLLTMVYLLMIAASLPLSLFMVVKVVQVARKESFDHNISSLLFLGIRESSHLQTWSPLVRWGPGTWRLLHHTLCGYL